MSIWTPPTEITGMNDGDIIFAGDLKALTTSLETLLNGGLGNANVSAEVAQKIAYAKLNLAASILNSDIVSVDVSKFTTLKVTAQDPAPNDTVAVAAGKYTSLDGTATREYAGGNSGAFANPTVGNNRIDVLTIDDAGALAITAGAEGASPVAPIYPVGKIPLAEVFIRYNASGNPVIRDTDNSIDSYISVDARSLLSFAGNPDESVKFAQIGLGGVVQDFTFLSSSTDLGLTTSWQTVVAVASNFDPAAGQASGDRIILHFEGLVELDQSNSDEGMPIVEVRLMFGPNGGSVVEVHKLTLNFLAPHVGAAGAGVWDAPIQIPISTSWPVIAPGGGVDYRIEAQYITTTGGPGATIKGTVQESLGYLHWLKKITGTP
jgi:hypothetical protein